MVSATVRVMSRLALIDSTLRSASPGADGERVEVVSQDRPLSPGLPAVVAFQAAAVQPLAAFEVADPSLGARSAAQQPRQSEQRRRLSSASTMRRFAPRSRCRQRLTIRSWICRCRPVCPQRPHTLTARSSAKAPRPPRASWASRPLPDPRELRVPLPWAQSSASRMSESV
jgi:hypothetical protein